MRAPGSRIPRAFAVARPGMGTTLPAVRARSLSMVRDDLTGSRRRRLSPRAPPRRQRRGSRSTSAATSACGRAAAIKVLLAAPGPRRASSCRASSARRAPWPSCAAEHLVEVYDFVFEPRKERVAYVMEYLAGRRLCAACSIAAPRCRRRARRAHRRAAVRRARGRARLRRRAPRRASRQHHAACAAAAIPSSSS